MTGQKTGKASPLVNALPSIHCIAAQVSYAKIMQNKRVFVSFLAEKQLFGSFLSYSKNGQAKKNNCPDQVKTVVWKGMFLLDTLFCYCNGAKIRGYHWGISVETKQLVYIDFSPKKYISKCPSTDNWISYYTIIKLTFHYQVT